MGEVFVNRLLPAPSAAAALDKALRDTLGGVYIGFRSGWDGIVVVTTNAATEEDNNTARQIVLNHDMAARTDDQIELAAIADQTSGVIAQYLASPLSNRTPQDLYNEVRTEINAWTTLAEAKADLQQWLPFISALCQLVVRRIKVGDL